MSRPTRRAALGTTLGGLASMALARRAPAVVAPDAARPTMAQGVISGDVSPHGAIIWSRADRPARMHVEWSIDAAFRTITRGPTAEALSGGDFTARVGLTGLPPGRDVYYRVNFESLERPGVFGEAQVGRLRTPPTSPGTPVTFAWSGDTCGQGFGINPDLGGMRIYDRIRQHDPDLFVHCGDLIYADTPILAQRRLPDGSIWRNLVVPEKAKVAETLDEFHGNYRYPLLDPHVRDLHAAVSQVWQWDDHETKNNWWPGRVLDEDHRYRVKQCDVLAARARQAFFDYAPIARHQDAPGRIHRLVSRGPHLVLFVLDARSFRGPNSRNLQRRAGGPAAFFGSEQQAWLLDGLSRSTATWKIVASDQPLGLLIGHGPRQYEGVGNGGGPPLGRELEIAGLLAELKARKVRNVAWITADVHYAAAHFFNPARANFRNFDPFWEFVAGPLNAGTFGPNTLDPTFGPEARFVSVPWGLARATSPLAGYQFYGVGRIDPRDGSLRIGLHDLTGRELWSVQLPSLVV